MPTTQPLAPTIGCSLKTVCKTLLLKAILAQPFEHGEVELVPTYSIFPSVLVSLVQEGTLFCTLSKNHNTRAATKLLIDSGLLLLRYISAMVAQVTVSCSRRWNP